MMTDASSLGSAGTPTASRREFIRRLTSAAALTALGGAMAGCQTAGHRARNTSKSVVGSNVYGWGQYAARANKPLDIEEVLSALRDCGYDDLEKGLDVEHPEENAHFAEQLRAKGLQPVSLYAMPRLHEAAKAHEAVCQVLAAAKVSSQAGFCVLSCNAAPIGREKTDQELQTQAAALTELGQGLNALGMKLAVHQHLPEMANHAREFHYDFDHTQPNVVGWCYDVNWVWRGGIEPLDALRQYGNRVQTWHLRQNRNGVWWEDLDSGEIDYEAVAAYARKHNLARRFSVELALESGTRITRSVVENHRLSREWVRRVFGA